MDGVFKELLSTYWGNIALKPFQEEAVDAIISGKDCLVLAPTGGGKSLCYQLPAIAAKGVSIVVSPLLALIEDQVKSLHDKGIPAASVHSGMTKAEQQLALQDAVSGKLKLLYIAPERVGQRSFQSYLRNMQVAFLAIDEAHCISEWGHDFRPAFRNLHQLRDLLKGVPAMALTATATPAVQNDIIESVPLQRAKVITTPSYRTNLSFAVAQAPSKFRMLEALLGQYKGTAIVYVSTRAETRQLAEALQKLGYQALAYHAGLSGREKFKAYSYWAAQENAIMVATTAFGMGIDKAEVRLTVGYSPPENLESYYQQAGRAGRDGKPAACFLLFQEGDIRLLKEKILLSFPSLEEFTRMYNSLMNYLQIAVGSGKEIALPFSLLDFSKKFNQKPSKVYSLLEALAKVDLIHYLEAKPRPPRLKFILTSEATYDFQLRKPRLSNIIKYLLRIYGAALYERYQALDMEALSKGLNYSKTELEAFFLDLKAANVADYLPAINESLLYFQEERANQNRLAEVYYKLDRLKEVKLEKYEKMISYITTKKCRAITISEYFGQKLNDCGHCDNCIAKNNDQLATIKGACKGTETMEKRFYKAMALKFTDNTQLKIWLSG